MSVRSAGGGMGGLVIRLRLIRAVVMGIVVVVVMVARVGRLMGWMDR